MSKLKTNQQREDKKKGRLLPNRKITLSQMRNHPERWGEMKFLRYEEQLTDATGAPVNIPSNDTAEYSREVKNVRQQAKEEARKSKRSLQEVLETADFPDMPIIEEATVADAMIYFSNNIPWERDPEKGTVVEPATMDDMKFGIAVCESYRNIQTAEDDGGQFVEISDEALAWLKETLEKDGSRAFQGVIGAVLYNSLDDANLIEGEKPKIVDKSRSNSKKSKEAITSAV